MLPGDVRGLLSVIIVQSLSEQLVSYSSSQKDNHAEVASQIFTEKGLMGKIFLNSLSPFPLQAATLTWSS